MSRSWYVSPVRVRPGSPVPGQWESSWCAYDGPSPWEMAKFRGPVPRCADAVDIAQAWREKGKRSDLWLVCVDDGECTHCTKFDIDRASKRREAETAPG